MTPPASAALLLVKVLWVILNEDSHVSMTPPTIAAQLSVKVLLIILNEDSRVYMTPPLNSSCTVVSKSAIDNIE